MKPSSLTFLAAAALLALVPADAKGQAPPPVEARVWFTGGSNVRPFTCRATQVGASDALPSVPAARDTGSAPVTLRIPVAGLDCGIGMMNRHLRHALHADRHPDIRFTLAEYELVPGDSGWNVRMDGRLAVAGVEQAVRIDGVVALDSAGVTHVRGTHAVRVADYGVRPPRRFLGLLRVREHVTVHFDVPLARPAPPIPSPASSGGNAGRTKRQPVRGSGWRF